MKLGFGTGAAIAIAIVIIIAALLMLVGGVPTISTATTESLSRNATYNFYLPSDKNVSSILAQSTSISNATIYLSRRPLLFNITVLHLSPGQSANVSLTGSPTADLNVLLVSSTSQAATLTLTYIPTGFGVRVSPGVMMVGAIGKVGPPSPTTTVSGTTTVSSGSVTTLKSTTTVAATTTVAPAVNETAQAIMSLNGTQTGALIHGFSNILIKQNSECTTTAYDTELGKVPSGQQTLQNVSYYVPKEITSSGVNDGGGNYSITYTEVIAAGNHQFALIKYNLSGDFIITSTFSGDFGNNYNAVLENYTVLNKTSDPCAIFGV